jgi:eukaryotic-like serine/threonine-protein kinase
MGRVDADRNLLTGILGLQTGLYTQPQLILAMQAWVFQKERNIECILLEQGALPAERKDFLYQLVDQYLRVSNSSPQDALSQLPLQPSIVHSLQSIEDPELSYSITVLRSRTTPNREPSPANADLEPTETFESTPKLDDARYKILRPHAKGGLGQVSVAEDKQLHREVALKQIKEEFVQNEESRIRFLVEAEITGQLEHPGIVPVYSLGFSESGPYYAMRFIRGESLKQTIETLYQQKSKVSQREFMLAIRKLVKRLIDAGFALGYAHSRGVLHRDVKPSNIMLGKYGETLLVDWGLAKSGSYREDNGHDGPIVVPLSGDSSTDTRMGSIVGTIAYMSPEQAQGRLDLLGPWSDVYSLGATLYCILTSQPPVSAKSQEELLEKVQTSKIAPVRDLNPVVPNAVAAICQKCMANKIDDRYKSVNDFIDDLELWLADEPISIYREPWVERILRTCRRHKTAVGVSSALIIATIVGSLILHLVTQYQNAKLRSARNDATYARKQAENNLQRVQNLSLVLLNSAEEKLSAPAFTKNADALKLRRQLTEEATVTLEEILPQSPNDPDFLGKFAQVLRKSANFKRLDREYGVARQRIIRSIEIQEGTPDESRTPVQRDLLAETYRDQAGLEKTEGNYTGAIEILTKSQELCEKNLKVSPDSIPFKRTLATTQLETIGLLDDMGKSAEALVYAEKVAKLFRELAQIPDGNQQEKILALFAEARLIQILGKLKRYEEAESKALAFLEFAKIQMEATPDDINLLIPFCRILYWSAENLMTGNGDLNIAEQRLKDALSRIKPLETQVKLASVWTCSMDVELIYGIWLQKHARYGEADSMLTAASNLSSELVKVSALHGYLYQNSRINFELGKTKRALKDQDAARKYLEIAQNTIAKASEEVPVNVEYRRMLTEIQVELADLSADANSATK